MTWNPQKQDIEIAGRRIQHYIHRTPVLTNNHINIKSNATIYFKAENLQKTGSFKVRGAANAILQLSDAKLVCTNSSGNFGQGVAYMADRLKIRCIIVVAKDTPISKLNAIKDYKAQIVYSGPTITEQREMSKQLNKELNAVSLEQKDVVIGAATAAYELYQEVQYLDYLVAPIGSGGLCSGTLLATKYYSPKTIVIGVQPYLSRDAKDSLQKGALQAPYPPLTLAEGVRASLKDITFDVIKQYLSDIILVDQNEIIEASRLLMQRMKIVVELSGALVLAAILKDERFRGARVGAIISGGNMDLSTYFDSLLKKASQLAHL